MRFALSPVALTLLVSLLSMSLLPTAQADDCPQGSCELQSRCKTGCSASACEKSAGSDAACSKTTCTETDTGAQHEEFAFPSPALGRNVFSRVAEGRSDRQRHLQRGWGTLINDVHLRRVAHKEKICKDGDCPTDSACEKACRTECDSACGAAGGSCEKSSCQKPGSSTCGTTCDSVAGACDSSDCPGACTSDQVVVEDVTDTCGERCAKRNKQAKVHPHEAAGVILELMESMGQRVLDGTEFQAVCTDHPTCLHEEASTAGSREAIVRFIRALDAERAESHQRSEELPPPAPQPYGSQTEIDQRVVTLREASAVLDQVSSDLESQDLYLGADHVRGLAHSLRQEARELQRLGNGWSAPVSYAHPPVPASRPTHPMREAMQQRVLSEQGWFPGFQFYD